MKPFRLGLMMGLLFLLPSAPRADEAPPREKLAATDRHGDPLPKFVLSRLGTVRFRQGSPVATLRFAPDGKTLVTAGTDQSLRMWDAETGRETGAFTQGGGDDDHSADAVFERVGRSIYFGGQNNSWVLSPDAKVLAKFDYNGNGTVQLFNVATGKVLHKLAPVQNRGGNGMFMGFSPDGKQFAGVAQVNNNNEFYAVIRLWNVADGKELRVLEPPAAKKENNNQRFQPNNVTFSPDGKHIASVGYDGRRSDAVQLWDAETGKLLPALVQPNEKATVIDLIDGVIGGPRFNINNTMVGAPFFSPDGKLFAGIVQNNRKGGARVRLWDPATGKHVRDLEDLQNGINHAAFAPDGKRLVVMEGGSNVRVFDPQTGKEMPALPAGNAGIYALAFAPDGKTLAIGHGDNTIQLFDLESAKELHKLTGYQGQHGQMNIYQQHHGLGSSIAFSPDATTVAAAGGGMVRLWSVATGKEILPIQDGHASAVHSVAVAPDGKTLASFDEQGVLRLWDLAAGKELRIMERPGAGGGEENPVVIREFYGNTSAGGVTLQFSPDGKALAGATSEGAVHLWDPATGKHIRKIKGHDYGTPSLAFAPNGKALATGGSDGRVFWWDVATGKQLRQFAGPLAKGGDDDEPVIIDVFGNRGGPATVTVSPDGKMLAAITATNLGQQIQMWELTSGKLRRAISIRGGDNNDLPFRYRGYLSSNSGGNSSLAFSPDCKTLAWAAGSTVRLFDALRGKELRQFGGQTGSISGLRFAPAGKLLAASNADGTIRLWDTATGTIVTQLTGHRGATNTLAFVGDGKTLATSGADTTVLLWDVQAATTDERADALTDKDLAALWQALAGDDAQKVAGVMERMTAAPRQTAAWLKDRVPVAPALDADKVAKLLDDLEGDNFAKRNRANTELEKLGELAKPALEKRLTDMPPLEVQKRIQALLDKLKGPVTEPNKLRALRAIEILEHIGTPEAQEVLQKVAKGTPEAQLTLEAHAALARLKANAPR